VNKKQLRFCFNEVINVAEKTTCKDLHHKKGQRHGVDEICGPEYHIAKCCHELRKYMKENNI